MRYRNPSPPRQGQFESFDASELFCGKCRRSMPVRKRLLLVLPEGEKYDYVCQRCGESVGTHMAADPNRSSLLFP